MFGAILTLTLRGEHFSKTPQSTRDNEQLTQYHIDPYASSVARPNKNSRWLFKFKPDAVLSCVHLARLIWLQPLQAGLLVSNTVVL